VEVVRIGDDDPHAPTPLDGPGPEAEVPEPLDLRLVLVRWRDAWFDFDQGEADEERADYLVTTVGFVVREGPRFISVAQEILPDGDGFRAVTHIPRSVVEAIVPLSRDHGGSTNGSAAGDGLYSADIGAEVAPDDRRRDA
jgi:hypothetical protein